MSDRVLLIDLENVQKADLSLAPREARVLEFFYGAARLLPAERFLLGGSGWEHNVSRPAQ